MVDEMLCSPHVACKTAYAVVDDDDVALKATDKEIECFQR